MAKKQKSFAEKASSKGGKDLVYVKYVKSVPSEKEGYWRFNESMVAMEKGSSLDAALKEMEDAANLVDIELPAAEEAPAKEESAEEAPAKEESAKEAPAQEVAEAPAKEESAEEAPAQEDSKDKSS